MQMQAQMKQDLQPEVGRPYSFSSPNLYAVMNPLIVGKEFKGFAFAEREEHGLPRIVLLAGAAIAACFISACGTTAPVSITRPVVVNSTTPNAAGIPLFVTGNSRFAFLSVQSTGQIFTYDISSGTPILAVPPYAAPCSDPSGLAVSAIARQRIMAVVCYDTGSLLPLTVHDDGTLSALGSVSGLPSPFPGIALDGTNVLVPLFGISQTANGGIAKVDISTPSKPIVSGVATLASPPSGGFSNPGFLTVSNGHIVVSAGSESSPITTSSTLQIVDEGSMTVVGQPLAVAHSPQEVAISGKVAFAAFYDAAQLESIDLSDITQLKPLQIFSLASLPGCHALPIAISGKYAYVGCYPEGTIEKINITDPKNMQSTDFLVHVESPQHLYLTGDYILVSGSQNGGSFYEVNLNGN